MGILVWLCDEKRHSTLIVTGMVAVRDGHATQYKAEAHHRRMQAEVTGDQTVQDYRLLFIATVQKRTGYDAPVGFRDER
ncbi:MAG: hypothetical protein EBV06_16780 [Planctomycetia bacterium]|nr:hypothetical protein [Planctomycetia bacterium]